MKRLALFFLSLTCLVHVAMSQFKNEKEIESLLNKIRSKTITADERKEVKAIAFDLQNKGQLLDEHQHDYKGALENVDKAIILFDALEDTLDIANNKKFKGYLLGRFARFAEAKAEIAEAINLFGIKGKDWGVAVSQFDLARVYSFENKIDSAVHYTDITVSYWRSKGNNSRVLSSNTLLIDLLTRSKQLAKARPVQKESELLSADPELHWQNIIDLYFVSMQFYKAVKETGSANHYHKLYNAKIAELKKEGITARSYYEIN